MTINKITSLVLFCSMLTAFTLSALLKPQQNITDFTPKVKLVELIPEVFSTWQYIPQYSVTIVNPELNDLLGSIYDQVLNRFYKNANGNLIMLSISYGLNQIDDGSLHLPEVCYPAQGFTLEDRPYSAKVKTAYGPLKVKRLYVKKDNREEFITYWTMIGSSNVSGIWDTKYAQINYGLKGVIPDGLVFRISSIGKSSSRNIALHDHFIRSLLSSMNTQDRTKLTGLQ